MAVFISGVEGSRSTSTITLPSGHLALSHLKTLARSEELRPPTLFVLPTTTAICRAAHEPARTNDSNATVKIRLGIATRLLIGNTEQQVTAVIATLFSMTYLFIRQPGLFRAC